MGSKHAALIEEVTVRLQCGEDPKRFERDLTMFLKNPSMVRSSVIDCSVQPMIPNGWSIHEEDQIASRFQGKLIWDAAEVGLHLDPAQADDGVIKGEDLRKKLEGQLVLPANVLDYSLLAHPGLIPMDWKGKSVFFWGTIYRDLDGSRYVRYLYWDDGVGSGFTAGWGTAGASASRPRSSRVSPWTDRRSRLACESMRADFFSCFSPLAKGEREGV